MAKNFTLKRNGGGKHIRLSDYEGQIIVLDFFAWWCGPCRATSPDVEKNVAKFFHDRGGNKNKIPVKLIGINIEQDNPSRIKQFIKDAGMEDAVDDFSRVAFTTVQQEQRHSAFCHHQRSRHPHLMTSGKCSTTVPVIRERLAFATSSTPSRPASTSHD